MTTTMYRAYFGNDTQQATYTIKERKVAFNMRLEMTSLCDVGFIPSSHEILNEYRDETTSKLRKPASQKSKQNLTFY